MQLKDEIKKIFKGDIDDSKSTIEHYSTDASIFKIPPEIVLYPKDREDVSNTVKFANEWNTKNDHKLHITARGAGTCMSGGAINTSIILDFTKYMNRIIEISGDTVTLEPGVFYRDFETELAKHGKYLPCFTASKDLCTLGGMFGNNSGGEQSIKHGKMENYVIESEVILNDGSFANFIETNISKLTENIPEKNRQLDITQKIWQLIAPNYSDIINAKPNVSKNSAGYYLWNVYDKNSGSFNLNKLLVGSQGTLGIMTSMKVKVIDIPKNKNLLVAFLPDIHNLGEIVDKILKYNPDSIESFDDYSLKIAEKYIFNFFAQVGFWKSVKLFTSFIPDFFSGFIGKQPKLILLIEISGDNINKINSNLLKISNELDCMNIKSRLARNQSDYDKYWKIRHESFNLLRNHAGDKKTAPFIDDIIVLPEHLPEFLPQLEKILTNYKLIYTIAGHAGNGNFHIIPLMHFGEPGIEKIISEVSDQVYDLVLKFKGSITAEHNDGIIRTPYLGKMYGEKIVKLFEDTKRIFDPNNIFNPGKKVLGTKENIHKWLKK
jgi:FAD/FMN-containing dehydrogenase